MRQDTSDYNDIDFTARRDCSYDVSKECTVRWNGAATPWMWQWRRQ